MSGEEREREIQHLINLCSVSVCTWKDIYRSLDRNVVCSLIQRSLKRLNHSQTAEFYLKVETLIAAPRLREALNLSLYRNVLQHVELALPERSFIKELNEGILLKTDFIFVAYMRRCFVI